jgi:hypothetical protein
MSDDLALRIASSAEQHIHPGVVVGNRVRRGAAERAERAGARGVAEHLERLAARLLPSCSKWPVTVSGPPVSVPSLPAEASIVKLSSVTAGAPVMFASMGMSTLSQDPGTPDGFQLLASPHDDPSPWPVQVNDAPEQLWPVTCAADAGPAANVPTAQPADSARIPIHARR